MDFVQSKSPPPIVAKGDNEPATTTTPVAGSTTGGPRLIKEGDMVIIMESHDTLTHTTVKPKGKTENRWGVFHHDDMIGQEFGTAVRSRGTGASRLTGGWVVVLAPTPELWAASFKVRTQIIQPLDQSMITFQLRLKPGSLVVESGTGSGAMSTSIARCISPNGHLHTFEFNENRVVTAREEFESLGLSDLITVHHMDVCGKLGSDDPTQTPLAAKLRAKCDAVLLDLPEPWMAIKFARHVLKPNGVLATYSPCIEQVQKTLEKIKEHRFHSCRTLEVRLKSYDVKPHTWYIPKFGDPETPSPEEAAVAEVPTSGPSTEGPTSDNGDGGGKMVEEEAAGEGEKEAAAMEVSGNGEGKKGAEEGANGKKRPREASGEVSNSSEPVAGQSEPMQVEEETGAAPKDN